MKDTPCSTAHLKGTACGPKQTAQRLSIGIEIGIGARLPMEWDLDKLEIDINAEMWRVPLADRGKTEARLMVRLERCGCESMGMDWDLGGFVWIKVVQGASKNSQQRQNSRWELILLGLGRGKAVQGRENKRPKNAVRGLGVCCYVKSAKWHQKIRPGFR